VLLSTSAGFRIGAFVAILSGFRAKARINVGLSRVPLNLLESDARVSRSCSQGDFHFAPEVKMLLPRVR
jgi:hypothetical protein